MRRVAEKKRERWRRSGIHVYSVNSASQCKRRRGRSQTCRAQYTADGRGTHPANLSRKMIVGLRQRDQRHTALVANHEARNLRDRADARERQGGARCNGGNALRGRTRRSEAKFVIVTAGEQTFEAQCAFRASHERAPAQATAESPQAPPWRRRPIARGCATGRPRVHRTRRAPRMRRRATQCQVRFAAPAFRAWPARWQAHRRRAACGRTTPPPQAQRRQACPTRRRRRPASRRERNSACPVGTSPMMVTQRLRGPRVVSPPTSSTSCASASA